RRPRGDRQVHPGPAAGRATGRGLPRHGRDVPGGDPAAAARRDRPRRHRRGGRRDRGPTDGDRHRRGGGAHPAGRGGRGCGDPHGAGDRRRLGRVGGARGPGEPGGLAAAPGLRRRDRGARGARHRHRGAARRRGEGIPHREPRDPCPPPDRAGPRRGPRGPLRRGTGRGDRAGPQGLHACGQPAASRRRRRRRRHLRPLPGRGPRPPGGAGRGREHRPAGRRHRRREHSMTNNDENAEFDLPTGPAEEVVEDAWDDDTDWDAVAEEWADELGIEIDGAEVLPTVAIVGRPNVGKSTLVNRIIGRREAVVEDVPGVTRDRVSYEALWNGRSFMVQDTGGWEQDARGMHRSIAQQAEIAMGTADVIVLVCDGTVGITAADATVARTLRRSQTPVLLAVNKVDSEKAALEAAEFWSLGLDEPYPLSATHGRGTADLLDEVLRRLPSKARMRETTGAPRR